MKDEVIFKQKGLEGYLPCFSDQCAQREQCLHWLVHPYTGNHNLVTSCVNCNHKAMLQGECPFFRIAEKQHMACGMISLLSNDMPRRVEDGIRRSLFKYFGRTYYYEYRAGKRLLSPKQQADVARIVRRHGWDQPVQFDGFIEDYDW